MVQLSFTMLTLSVISMLALILGGRSLRRAVGRRRRTDARIGVRMALGASSGAVRWMVATRGLVVVAIGVVSPGLGVARHRHARSPLLFGIEAGDPAVFVTMPLALLGIGLIAGYLPALRASRVNQFRRSVGNDS